jgi:hypothetical protein
MLGLGAQADGIFPGANEITQRLILGRRDADRGEFARPMQPRQRLAIATIGLDPIPAPLGHAGRIDDYAVFTLRR